LAFRLGFAATVAKNSTRRRWGGEIAHILDNPQNRHIYFSNMAIPCEPPQRGFLGVVTITRHPAEPSGKGRVGHRGSGRQIHQIIKLAQATDVMNCWMVFMIIGAPDHRIIASIKNPMLINLTP